MSYFSRRGSNLLAATALAWAAGSTTAWGTYLDDIGVTQLRAQVPNLTGTGVIVAMPEGTTVDTTRPYTDHDNFEIDAVAAGVSVPITYVNSIGAQVSFDPAYTSSHATLVAGYMAGVSGVAPNLAGILNYNANEYNDYVVTDTTIPLNPQVINQSYAFTVTAAPYTADVLNQCWDSFVAAQGVIVVSGAGLGGDVLVPATAYNVIAVGAYGGVSPVSQPGQPDKPDITAPAGGASYSAPMVSGAAAMLVQAATGANFAAGGDPRVIKALLLNGAVKPGNWTHDSADPLDRRYGAGILNVYNSYENLIVGPHVRTSFNRTSSLGGSHPPSNATAGFVDAAGWNLGTLSSSGSGDGVDHYVIDLSQNPSGVPLILTATLTWWRAQDAALTNEIINATVGTPTFTSAINTNNNLDLYLFNTNSTVPMDQSVSQIDNVNVEHLYTLNLAPDKYDLQVLKNGGSVGSPNVFSSAETYGLAWNAASITAVPTVTNNTALTFNQTGSITVAATILGTGALTQSGAGTTTLTGAANYSGPTVISAGKLSFGGGTGHSIAGVSGSGVLQVLGGTGLTSDGVYLPTGTLSNAGTEAIRSSGTTGAYYNFARGQSSSALTGTSKIGGAGLSLTGSLDIRNNALIVEAADTSSKAMLLATIAGDLGGAITSSTATNNVHYTLDVIDNGKLGATMFGGLPVDPLSIIVTEALMGDANFDGIVSLADLATWKANFGKAGVYSAASGDFNHDGNVNLADLALWKANFGSNISTQPAPLDVTPGGPVTLSVGTFSGGVGAVPEPASLLVLGWGLVGLPWRRRRRILRKSVVMIAPNVGSSGLFPLGISCDRNLAAITHYWTHGSPRNSASAI